MNNNHQDEISSLFNLYDDDLFRFSRVSFDLPQKKRIDLIITYIQKIFFPGFYEKDVIHASPSKGTLAYLLATVEEELTTEIARAFIHQDLVLEKEGGFSNDEKKYCEIGREICILFLKKIPSILEVLITDVKAGFEGDPAAESYEQIIMSYPGFYATMVQRIAHELFLLKVPIIPRCMTESAHSVTGIDIHPGAVIGKSFFIDHGTGVVIGETTIIGNHVKLYQGVTLGALSTSAGQGLKGIKRHPTLEDRVTVYSGSSVLGGETVIGHNSTIGGNVFITHSVPPETTVILKTPEMIINEKK